MEIQKEVLYGNSKGISLISLIITVIVIILLASITIFNGMNTPEQAQFAKFSTEVANLQEAVDNQYNKRYGDLVKRGATFTDPEIYAWIAAGDAATSSGWVTVTPGEASLHYGSTILSQDSDGNDLEWQVKVITPNEKEVVEIDLKNNNLKTSIPNYEDRTWKLNTKDGTVFIDPPVSYDGVEYATLADVQKGGRN